jgi:hypothetical protein
MFRKAGKDGAVLEKPEVTNTYRYLAHSAECGESIRNLVGDTNGGAIQSFYSRHSYSMPGDTDNQSININYVESEVTDPYSILCYSTVHCLQPYQIHAFDEIKGGVYYKYYAERISEMQSVQRYSMTPHLDKRWHKHGTMPYINVSKEVERRYDLAKAFLYALCYGKIGFVQDGSESRLMFQDLNLGRELEAIIYNGRFIPINKINRAMNWFANQETLIERYAVLFDQAVDAEVEKLSKYTDTVGGYKSAINNYARILNQMKRNIFRDLDSKKTSKKEANSILTFAWKLHLAEENELDKDYAELLVQTLCQVIKKYAKAPYNRDDIENRAEGTASYRNYVDVGNHIVSTFLEDFASSVGKKLKVEQDTEAVEERRRKNSFGRDDSDLSDETGNLSIKGGNEDVLLKNASYEWVRALLDSAFNI